MKVLVVEDDRRIKTETIDDALTSLGHNSDWAENQQEALGFLAANHYDLVLLDLQIPSRPGGKASPEFGKNLLKQIRARKEREHLPVILMTAQYQHCVDLMMDLNELGLNGSIAKPFPASGRTLAVVIEEVLNKHRRFRQAQAAKGNQEPLKKFTGGVLGFHPDRIELCGETIVLESSNQYAWQILHLLRKQNERGAFIGFGSGRLCGKLKPSPTQNTLIKAIGKFRKRITQVMSERLNLACASDDVIATRGDGYQLREWILIEDYDDVGTLASATTDRGIAPAEGSSVAATALRLSERQRWILAQLGSGQKMTRRDVEEQFGIATRTAKRILGELADAGLIEFDRAEYPGFYRLK